jgi:selenocysteine-specific elongation factor
VLGDRFIVRAYSPQVTIGGGTILDPFAVKHRARDFAAIRAALEILAKGDRAARFAQFVTSAGVAGVSREDIAARTAWRERVIDAAFTEAKTSGAVMSIENRFLSRAAFDEVNRQVVAEVAAHHQREPLSRGLAKEILRERFFAGASAETFRAIMVELEKSGSFVVEKEIVRLREHTRQLSDEDAQLRDSLEKIYRDAGLAAPALADAFTKAGLKPSDPRGRKILQLLIDSGALIKVHGEMFFHRLALDELVKKLHAHAERGSDRAIDVGAFKDLAGISRKYAIPLLEYLDRQRVTRREGERRLIL